MNTDLLLKSYIFKGMDERQLKDALTYLNAREVFYKKGENLIMLSNPINEFAVVLSGAVQVSCDDINGNRMIMTTVARGDMFSESLAVTACRESPINATAAEDTWILWLSADIIRRNESDNPVKNMIVLNFINAVANKCLMMNDRVQILSKKTIREKVITYLSQVSEQGKKLELKIPFDRQGMADYLGVERSALSRELSRMEKEGIISYKKNIFTILKGQMLL